MKKGFTLIEFVIVIVILSIISQVIGMILLQSAKASNLQYRLSILSQESRLGLSRISRELQIINSLSDLTAMGMNDIKFKTTDGNIFSYSLSGNNLMEQINSQTPQILSGYVGNLLFNYYDQDGAATAVNTNVRYIKITLGMEKDETIYTQTMSIFVRNFSS